MKKGYLKLCRIMILFLMIISLVGCNSNSSIINETVSNGGKNQLKIHYIDVGQADSILIQNEGKNMLIDAGNNDDDELVADYLKKNNVTKIDYLVGTHPHEDHIGGLDYIINNFQIEKVLMPKKISTTKTFRDVVEAAKRKNLKFTVPKVGETFNLGEAKCTVLAPDKEYEDANNNSIVIKLQYGNNKFLFTGDAESVSEEAMLSKNLDLSADVLKLGHHGSRTSSSDKFLNAVKPKFAIVSCGKNNDYGHPHKETMKKMKERNIKVYRTDESGTIVVTSDGNNISFDKKEGSYKEGVRDKSNSKENNNKEKPQYNDNASGVKDSNSSNKKNEVYFTPKGKAYHYDKNCSALSKSKEILSGTLKEAKNKGKADPCDRCAK